MALRSSFFAQTYLFYPYLQRDTLRNLISNRHGMVLKSQVSLSRDKDNYKCTIFFANSPWMHYFSLIHCEFAIFITNSILIQYLFLRIHFKCTFVFAVSLWIHYLFREFTIKTLSYSRNHFECTIFFDNSIWQLYLFRESTMNSLSFSQINYEFTIFFANSLWIHFLSRESTMN